MRRIPTLTALLLSLGTLHAQWVQLGDSANSSIDVMKVYDGKLFLAGNMTRFNGLTTYFSMSYNGTSFSMHPTMLGGSGFSCLEVYNDQLYGGGTMVQSGQAGTVQWAGGTWAAGPISTNNTINVLSMLNWNNLLIFGGSFTVPQTRIVQYNGTTAQAMGAGFDNSVLALAAFNGSLYAAGTMTHSGSTNIGYVAKWNGTGWEDVGGGFNNYCTAIVAHDGFLYAAGAFTTAGGVAAGGIARWNGSVWQPVGGSITAGSAMSLESTSAGLLVGGVGMSVGTVSGANALLFDGSAWSQLPGIPPIESVLDFEEYQGRIYAVGYRPGSAAAGHVYRNTSMGFAELDPFPALQAYPNPSSGQLQLAGLTSFQGRFEVMDATGRTCLGGGLDNTLDVSSLLPGSYVLRILTPQGSTVRRFMRSY
ncbi:MAG TPA: T9SS type A sorting domain-containing protein [Flavobacteriales bacterium]|nr:T9SS type A sorting domain-containing protein [Flavobacteriales bacterium]